MDSRLQKFARLVEIRNFTRAAKELHISQPALSIAIDKLEQEVGAKLLIRDNRSFELTEAGKAVYAAALEQQNVIDHLVTELSHIAKRRPAVTIGMTDSVAAMLCVTDAFSELEQASDITIVVNNSRYLRAAVEQRQMDLAYVVDDGVDHPGLFAQPAGMEELVLVCHPDLLEQTEADLAKGHLYNFVCYDKPSTTYRHIMHTLKAHGIRPYTSLFSTSPDVLMTMARQGKGVGVLPKFLVSTVPGHTLVSPKLHGQTLLFERPISIITQAGKRLPPYLKLFVENAHIV